MEISAPVGPKELYVRCDREYASVAKQLLALMAGQASKGNPVFEGMTIQFGWTVFTLKRRSGKLTLHEPDFDNDPTTDLRPDVSCSIDVYLLQQAVIADLGLSNWRPANCFEEIVAGHGSLAKPCLIARHYADKAGETGWVVFSREVDQPLTLDNLSDLYGKLPVWQWPHVRPALLRYLALPTGYTVFMHGDDAERIVNEDGETWG